MTSRQWSIDALLDRCDEDFLRIEKEYNQSLSAHAIDPGLKIDIKNLCGNLRSVLDYLAHEIREKYCATASSGDRFYFPVLPDAKSFAGQCGRWYPGLQAASPDVWRILEDSQPYQSGTAWLGVFNQLNNDNKHGDLVEQTRVEVHEVRATSSGGGMVSWNPGAVRFGSGVFINGVPVDPRTQMPVPHPSQKVERLIWVDFHFAGTGTSALRLLRDTIAGIRQISSALRPYL